MLSRSLGTSVSLNLPRKHKKDPKVRLQDECARLASEQILMCELDIPNAVSPLKVVVDLPRRTVNCSMDVLAPTDKKRGTARLNWMLQQLRGVDLENAYLKVSAKGRNNSVQERLSLIRENSKTFLKLTGKELCPVGFTVLLIVDLAGKFSGRKTFIQAIEDAVNVFYDQIGQYLRPWVPKPPKPSDPEAQTIIELNKDSENQSSMPNDNKLLHDGKEKQPTDPIEQKEG